MGEKGTKKTEVARETAERLVEDLAPLGHVTAKAMFGGYGIMESGVMFVLIDSAGAPHFRANETTEQQYVDAGSTRHSRMPYWSIPEDVLDDQQGLLDWANSALQVARAARK